MQKVVKKQYQKHEYKVKYAQFLNLWHKITSDQLTCSLNQIYILLKQSIDLLKRPYIYIYIYIYSYCYMDALLGS